MDIPFIRFAFPVFILYLFWSVLLANPWVEETQASNKKLEQMQELVARGKELIAAGRLEEALDPSLQLHKAYPENQIYIKQLADIYDSLGRFTEAAPMWEHYLEYSPTPIEGCPQIALAYRNLGQRAEEAKAFERCWHIEANSDTILFYAHSLEMQGQYGRALELYRDGFSRAPDYADMAVGLARIQMRVGQIAEARTGIAKVLEKAPDNVDGLLVAGMVFARTGERAAAIRYLEKARTLAPDYKELGEVLASVRRGG